MHTSFAVVPPIPEATSTMSCVLRYHGEAVKSVGTGETVYANLGASHNFKAPWQGSYNLSPLGRVGLL